MDQPSAIWSHCLDQASLSDVGLQRANNQDAFVVALADNQADFEKRGHLFMVADGMGAHAAGELASKMAVDIVSMVYRKRLERLPSEAILLANINANHQIYSRGLASPDFRGMGTTATTLLLLGGGVLVAHVGDSRAYRWRNHRLDQLTFDHSLVWEMRAAGQFPNGQLPSYVSKNIITRSLGPHPAVKVDLEGPHPAQIGDVFLLCSDGLSNQLKDDEIGLILGCLPPAEAVRVLADLANLRGGPDNITVVVAKVLGPQIAQTTTDTNPVRADPHKYPPIHPVIWILMGVAFLAGIGLFGLGYPWSGILSLACAAMAGVTAVMQRYAGTKRSRLEERKFGRGPYVSSDCTPNPDLLSRLNSVLQELHDTAIHENWQVDWNTFNGFIHRASAATQAARFPDAANELLHALLFIMNQLRQFREAAGEDVAGP